MRLQDKPEPIQRLHTNVHNYDVEYGWIRINEDKYRILIQQTEKFKFEKLVNNIAELIYKSDDYDARIENIYVDNSSEEMWQIFEIGVIRHDG